MPASPPVRPARPCRGALLLVALVTPFASLVQAQSALESGTAQASPTAAAAPTASAESRFIVVPYPIVDPALGNGLLLGPVWMRDGPRPASGPSRPQAYGLGAIRTDGGTRGMVAFDHRAWGTGAWRTTALAGVIDLHFAYAGLRPESDNQFGFAIEATGASLSAEHAIGVGPHSVNFSVFTAQADISFDQLPPTEATADIGSATLRGGTLGWARDTRDDVFLPSTGSAQSAKVTVFSEALGASFNAQTLALKWTRYQPIGRGVVGVRAKGELGLGDSPFYLRPYISFRGVAALRYAGERVLSVEAEYRHPIHGSWDALVFAGSGHARSDFRGIEASKSVSAAGVGVRFKAAKLFGLTFGLDFAQGPDGLVSYIQIGNAWTN